MMLPYAPPKTFEFSSGSMWGGFPVAEQFSGAFSAAKTSASHSRILVTGAAGFFGHHFCEHVLRNTDWEIVALVRLGRIGNLRRLTDIECWPQEQHRVHVVWHDLRSPIPFFVRRDIGRIDYIVHAAASTHVDESIKRPGDFVMDNVLGTLHMLEYARNIPTLKFFQQFSTDEVYGPAPEGVDFLETDAYNATNPYAATKAGAEQLVNAFGNTYSLPVFISNCMNLIGERASHEKYLPLCIRKIVASETITIHADPTKTQAGQRHYLHCRNAAAATLFLLEHAEQRGRYNVVGDKEIDNLTFAQMVADIIGKPLKYELVDFHSSRPGHDRRYSLSGEKLKKMGFSYPKSFEETLERTVRWTLEHPEWLRAPDELGL